MIKSWQSKWEYLSAYFRYPEPIRKVIYTTNSIEAVHRQFRKLTKTKGGFPNDLSLLKLLYLGTQNASKKWTMPIQNWNLTLSHSICDLIPTVYFDATIIRKTNVYCTKTLPVPHREIIGIQNTKNRRVLCMVENP